VLFGAMKRIFILLIVISSCWSASGQSLPGPSGLLNIPSADMQKDGTFYAGLNYLNKEYLNDYGGNKFNCLAYYFDLTFLPFLEINFRSTRLLNKGKGNYTVDRMFSGRLRLLKEKKNIPSFVIGGNDIYTSSSSSGNQYFGALYAVFTKYFIIDKSNLGLTFGYGFDALRNNQIKGFFAGISFKPSFLKELTIIFEHDTRCFNAGATILLFNHLYLFAMAQGLKVFSGGIAYRIYLK